jgi:hypothetical protein
MSHAEPERGNRQPEGLPMSAYDEHHPSCRESDKSLVWHCNQCGLNESAEGSEQEWTTEKSCINISGRLYGTSDAVTAKAIADAHKAALESAWSEHDDVVDALCVSNKTVMDLVTINRKLKEQLADAVIAERKSLQDDLLAERKAYTELEADLAAACKVSQDSQRALFNCMKELADEKKKAEVADRMRRIEIDALREQLAAAQERIDQLLDPEEQ